MNQDTEEYFNEKMLKIGSFCPGKNDQTNNQRKAPTLRRV